MGGQEAIGVVRFYHWGNRELGFGTTLFAGGEGLLGATSSTSSGYELVSSSSRLNLSSLYQGRLDSMTARHGWSDLSRSHSSIERCTCMLSCVRSALADQCRILVQQRSCLCRDLDTSDVLPPRWVLPQDAEDHSEESV